MKPSFVVCTLFFFAAGCSSYGKEDEDRSIESPPPASIVISDLMNSIAGMDSLSDVKKISSVLHARLSDERVIVRSNGETVTREYSVDSELIPLIVRRSSYRMTTIRSEGIIRTSIKLPLANEGQCIRRHQIQPLLKIIAESFHKDYDGEGFSQQYSYKGGGIKAGLYYMDGQCLTEFGFSQEERGAK